MCVLAICLRFAPPSFSFTPFLPHHGFSKEIRSQKLRGNKNKMRRKILIF
jgi:hypothetical protein